jgi:photosystem II stability/assembly factor-like uncharacterized protein
MLHRVGRIRLYEMRETKAPKDVEAPTLVRHVIQNRMKAVAERVGLQGCAPVEEWNKSPLRLSPTYSRSILAKYGCVVGYSTHMFCTTDEGVTWTSKDVLPVRSNGQSDFFKNLVILESGRGWVLREGGYLYRTIDSGLTWHVLDPINPSVSE